jgi:hypothetical protein
MSTRGESGMAIYQITKESLVSLVETHFDREGIYERKDLQRLIREHIEILGDDLLVITEEYGGWADSNRRIDLLCIDRSANLVVVELKRSEDGGHMELQAVRYAAMVSAMTFDQMVGEHARYLNPSEPKTDVARARVLEFLNWEAPDDKAFPGDVRIILAAEDFGKELTTSVIWLNDYGLRIRCVRLKPYRMESGAVLVDAQQIIPLPEAIDLQTQIGVKRQAERLQNTEQSEMRFKFWSELLEYARKKTALHANRKPNSSTWISGGIGRAGFSLTYTARQEDSQVELWIGLGAGRDEDNLRAFDELQAHKAEIEREFGEPLEWQELPESVGCRIRKVIQGGYRSPLESWPKLHEQLVDAMIRLDKVMRPHVQRLAV